MAESYYKTIVASDLRPVEAMSRAQIGLILGLETVLQAAGLVLTCRQCAANGDPNLDMNNDPSDEIWKIDCHCRRRRIARTDSRMAPSGWLLLLVPELLTPLGLDVRCPVTRCLLHPLTIHQSADRRTLTVTCQCSAVRPFTKTKTHLPH